MIIRKANSDDIWLMERGTWRRATITETGVKTAVVSCPLCGQSTSLSKHTIDRFGNVMPSLVCPIVSCKFHEYVILENWDQVILNSPGAYDFSSLDNCQD